MVLAGRPGAAAALLTAIFMLALLFGWPLYRLFVLASEQRTICIEGRLVYNDGQEPIWDKDLVAGRADLSGGGQGGQKLAVGRDP